MEVDYNNLDGWALPREAFDWIRNNIPSGSTILELGSGTGTRELVKYYTTYTIEENEKWVDKVPEANYIYAELEPFDNMNPDCQGWYSSTCLSKLPEDYDAIIIDGPAGINRVNFTYFSDYFKSDVPYIIDDTQRAADREMAIELAKKLSREYIEIVGRKKNTIILI